MKTKTTYTVDENPIAPDDRPWQLVAFRRLEKFFWIWVLFLVGCNSQPFVGEEHIWSGPDGTIYVPPAPLDPEPDAGPPDVIARQAAPKAPSPKEVLPPEETEPDAEEGQTDARAPESDARTPAREADARVPPVTEPDAPIDPCVGWTVVIVVEGYPKHCGAKAPDADGYRRFQYSRDCTNILQSVTLPGMPLPTLAPGTWYVRSDKGVACAS